MNPDYIDKELLFPAAIRRWGHSNTYRMKITATGWYFSHLGIDGDCDPSGEPFLYENLHQDGHYYPSTLSLAVRLVWDKLDSGEIDLGECEDELTRLAKWVDDVNAVERPPGF